MIYIYNSLTRKKELFKPIKEGHVGMYVCGVTVYDRCHLGHARSMVSFDVINRFLRAMGYRVKFVRNITDIDDKIINRAREQGISIDELTTTYIDAMNRDAAALGLLPPDVEPKATEHIDGIIQLIERLLAKDMAYVTEEGDVCYRVASFQSYGKLSHKDIDGLLAGARVEISHGKDSPLDFVLWKRAKPNEPAWESPWGMGRPGWHIECSAMAIHELGEQFDIHGGGSDLQFPHHENEIAQSEGATDKPFANYWMHVGMLQVNHEKMAKSLGNFFTIEDVLKSHHPEVVRYFLLMSHYRSPLNYSQENLLLAERALTRLYQTIRDVPRFPAELDATWVARFNEAMQDDFNTPNALSVLFELSHEINKDPKPSWVATLIELAGILGLLQSDSKVFLQAGIEDAMRQEVEDLIAARNVARQAKAYQKADEIRQSLLERGIELLDGPEGTTWRRL